VTWWCGCALLRDVALTPPEDSEANAQNARFLRRARGIVFVVTRSGASDLGDLKGAERGVAVEALAGATPRRPQIRKVGKVDDSLRSTHSWAKASSSARGGRMRRNKWFSSGALRYREKARGRL
jgi:hypothetical protein